MKLWLLILFPVLSNGQNAFLNNSLLNNAAFTKGVGPVNTGPTDGLVYWWHGDTTAIGPVNSWTDSINHAVLTSVGPTTTSNYDGVSVLFTNVSMMTNRGANLNLAIGNGNNGFLWFLVKYLTASSNTNRAFFASTDAQIISRQPMMFSGSASEDDLEYYANASGAQEKLVAQQSGISHFLEDSFRLIGNFNSYTNWTNNIISAAYPNQGTASGNFLYDWSGSFGVAGFDLGADYTNGFPWSGQIYEIRVYQSNIFSTNYSGVLSNLHYYATNKYGYSP